MGRKLRFNGNKERFAGNGELAKVANAMIKDDYRQSFEVPSIV